ARTEAVLVPSTPALAAQGACQIGCAAGRASNARQPTTNAGHAEATGSSLHPGNALHATGVNCARVGAGGDGGGRAGVTGGAGGTVWQPATSAATTHAARQSNERR